ncbi:MAG: hypothetical protein IJ637_06945 [Prevotella sp.]|nr:hypothetical protein [Prevotella sp.]
MKKQIILSMVGLALLLGSCGTYTGQGAYMGASLGGMLGSAIGGYSGGWRGSDMGTIVGMAGGAVVGAAVGSAEDRKAQERVMGRRADKAKRKAKAARKANDEEGLDAVYENGVVREAKTSTKSAKPATTGADDIIDLDMPGPQGSR